MPDSVLQRSAPIAWISPDRQVHVLDVHGESHPQTAGADPRVAWGWWDGGAGKQSSHSWPTWSPDGRRLACFASGADGTGEVLVMEVGGIASTAVADLQGRLPIYLFWSEDSDAVAILTQNVSADGDRLHLATARADTAGSEVALAEGTPLFFTWAEDRLAVFIGEPESRQARLAVLHATGAGETVLLPGRPGNFCAPVWLGTRLLYVLQHGASASVVMAGLDDTEPTVIESLTGLVALVRGPGGRLVARAVAPGGDGTPYRHLAVIDTVTGQVTPLLDEPCLAFLWLPDGSGLITARVDTERNLMRWFKVLLDGTVEHVIDMYPTRDFGFYLRFFEQYTQSHPLVDPDGQNLLLAGGLEGHGDPHRTTALWEVPLDGSEPRRVAEALFGVYGPRL